MKINGKNLAWAIIQLVLFISFLFADTEIDFKGEFFSTLWQLVIYFGILFILCWRFIKNMEESFK
jgi:hypothetical protein